MAKPALKRVEELFHQAVALDPPHRLAFLEAACVGDLDLRAAVEELLQHDREEDETEGFLTSPLAREAQRLRPEAATLPQGTKGRLASPGPAPPVIDGYQLLEELGRGGMGVVYKARQTRLNRIVALKMLLPGSLATAEMRARFRTEAEALARLNHPNIVSIYDIAESEGRPYFTMEYVAGPNLAQVERGRPQDASASARVLEVLARAIHVVHECGIIHRDLKPANILLMRDEGRGARDEGATNLAALAPHPSPLVPVPKITDFGLAKDQTTARKLTQSGMTMGTPCYMAPEQARSQGGDVGPAADIYALGAILYEMLTGRPPFDAGSPAETIAQLLSEEPLSPSRLRPGLPRDLVTICLKCLEKAPRRRYASALELAEDLGRFQAGQPIRARPVGWGERSYRWCCRRPLVAGLVTLSFLLAVALVIITVHVFELQARQALVEQTQAEEKQIHDQKRQIVQLNVTIGLSELELGDSFAAALRFTEALRLEEDPGRERNHRTRIALALRQGPEPTRFLFLDQPILCSNLAEGGRRVALVRQDHQLEVRDVWTGQVVGSGLEFREQPIKGAISSNGKFLGAIGANGTVTIWDLGTGQPRRVPINKGERVEGLVFHPDGRFLMVRGANAEFSRWSLANPEAVREARLSDSPVTYSALSDNGRWLFAIDNNHRGQMWDVGTGKASGTPLSLGHSVSLGAVHADGRRLALVGPGNLLTTWDVAISGPVGKPIRLSPGVCCIVFSPDGERLAVIGNDRSMGVWQILAAEVHAEFSGMDSVPTEVHFSPDGRLLLAHFGTGGARVWDMATKRAATPPLRHGGSLATAAFGPDGKQMVTISRSGTVAHWNLPGMSDQSHAVSGDEFPTTGRPKVIGTGRSIKLANRVTIRVTGAPGGSVHPSSGGERVVEQVASNGDGSKIAVCEDDTTVRIWTTATGEPLTPPLYHRGAVLCAAFSPDSSRLVTACDDKTACVWDTVTGEPLTSGLRHGQAIKQVFFRAGSERACVVQEDGVVCTWDLAPDQRPMKELVGLARVLACSHIDDQQQRQPFDSERFRLVWAELYPPR